MRPLVVAIEGVLAKEPLPDNFAAAGVNYDALWLLGQLTSQCVFVTGSVDRIGVGHWMRTQAITGPIEFPTSYSSIDPTDMRRLMVIENVLRSYRGNVVVIESSRRVRAALVSMGVPVLQPWWASRRAVLDDENFTPLRQVSAEFMEG